MSSEKTIPADMKLNRKKGWNTQLAHFGHPTAKDPYGSHVMPIYQTSTFVFDSAEQAGRHFAGEETSDIHAYSRLGNPTVEALETAIASLEARDLEHPDQARGMLFGSGMAAIATGIMGLAAGGHVLAQEALYGCTSQFLAEQAPELGITTTFVDGADTEAVIRALRADPQIRLVYLESIANPTMTVVDIPAIALAAHEQGALLMVDNTFATPYHLRPLSLGADVVVHSTTKYLSGHGTVIGGVLVAADPSLLDQKVKLWRKNVGGIAGPFDAWLSLQGLKTLALRMQRHADNAQAVAEWLQGRAEVAAVYYPGLRSHTQHDLARSMYENGYAGVLSFELRGGYEAAVSLLNQVKLCGLAVSLGHLDTLIEHPASMTHKAVQPEMRLKAGITDGLVRLALGIEEAADIIADLEQALGTEDSQSLALAAHDHQF